MSQAELSKIIDKSYSTFRRDNVVDFIKLGDRTVLELFHGPTLAFKDVAMQLLGNFYEYYPVSYTHLTLPTILLV